MTNKEKVCEKNCPDFNGMSILHLEQCDCSCHPVLAKGEIPMINTEKILAEYCKKFGLCKEKGTCQCRKELKFITKIVAQAIAEEREKVRGVIKDRIDYEKKYHLDANDYKSGFSGIESGECCKFCEMVNESNPLRAIVGCTDPFQINCGCHIENRKVAVAVKIRTLVNLLSSLDINPK